jgi:biopolymer transport protein ExbD
MIAKKKRTTLEVNAGSMADIAFLLLIFFLVTTTMAVDEGLAKNLPLKTDRIETPPINKRNVLEISLNANDELLVEDELIASDQVEEKIRHFYTANFNSETDENMPEFGVITYTECVNQIDRLNEELRDDPDNLMIRQEISKWQTRQSICSEIPEHSYNEMNRMSVIQIESQAKTSYKAYVHIINSIRKVVNELRVERCNEIWNRDYFSLNEHDKTDSRILSKLQIMIPERVIEKQITK